MNWSGWIFIFLVFLAVIPCSVHADAIQAVKTHVFFEKDGHPFNESVTYTFRCFGTTRYPPSDSGEISEVYRYSATCSGYGCGVWQPDTHQWLNNFDHCELQGETLGRNFTIENISPFSSCEKLPTTRISYDPSHNRTANEYYFWAPEAHACKRNGIQIPSWPLPKIFFKICDPRYERQCMELFDCTPPVKIISFSEVNINDTTLDPREYLEYLDSCNPILDENCPGWVVDGEPLKDKSSCKMNSGLASNLSFPCKEYLIKASPSLILPDEDWKTGSYGVPKVEQICDSVWTIPSDNVTSKGSPGVVQIFYTPQSPVASLYCSIVQLLGGRCE